MYKKTVLDNGIKIITEKIPHFHSASIGIWVQVGTRDETGESRGLSHFIEHMVFKGTHSKSAQEIAEIMDSVGGHLNAFTEKEQTCYYAKVVDKYTPLAIEILADMLQNAKLDPEDIEREKGVILEEIRTYEDSPEDQVFELFNKTLLGNHPLGFSVLGDKEVVNAIQTENIVKFIQDNYTTNQILICAAGNVEHEQLVALVLEQFQKGKAGLAKNNRTPGKVRKKDEIKYRKTELIYLCLGGKGLSQRDEDKYKFFVLDSILGGSMSSRLFQEIREKRGLVYSVFSFINSYYDCGLFGIHAGCNLENMKPVLNLIEKVCYELCDKGISQEELFRSKEHIKGGILLALESTSNRMIRLAKSETFHGRLISPEEIIKKIDKVSLKEVNQMAKNLLAFDQLSKIIVGPVRKGMFKN